jgi:tetratricopeptide (TPR) repeat protein
MTQYQKILDAFVCHATEDKDFVRPLANALVKRGLEIWYDEFTLKTGDSLRSSIDKGLVQSRFGIVVLSPHFFTKEWTKKELDGLIALEVDRKIKILPIWHNVCKADVAAFSPILAGKCASSSGKSLEAVVEDLTKVICPKGKLEISRRQSFLPPRLLYFVGRKQEKTKGIRVLCGSEPFVISGMSGTGKTALASEIAHHLAEKHLMPYEVQWCEMGMKMGLEQAIQLIATQLNIADIDQYVPEHRFPLLAIHLQDHKVLLVLDNVLNPQVLQLVLEHFRNVAVLVTTRICRLSGHLINPNKQTCRLGKLSADEAQDLLIQISGADKSVIGSEELGHIRDICKFVGNHPMAVTAAGARKSVWGVPFAAIKEDLKDILQEEKVPREGLARKTWSVTRLIETNYNHLRQSARRALRLAAAFPDSFTIGAFSKIMECLSLRVARQLIQEPLQVSLVNDIGDERFRLHDLIRALAWHKLEEAGEKRAVLERYVEYYTSFVEKFPVASSEFARESRNLFAAFDYSLEMKQAEKAVSLVEALAAYLGGTSAEMLDLDLHGATTFELRCELWRHCVELCRNSSSPLLAHVLWQYSRSLWTVSRFSEAEEALRDGLQNAIEYNDLRTEAGCLYSLSTCLLRKKNPQQALVPAEQGLRRARELRDVRIEGLCLHCIGWIFIHQGKWENAIVTLNKALTCRRATGNTEEFIGSLISLAHALKESGRIKEAEQKVREGLSLAKTLRNPNVVARCFYRLGSILDSQGRFKEALRYYEQYLENKKLIGDRNNVGTALHAIGYCKFRLGQYGEAERFIMESLKIKRDLDDPRGIAPSLEWIGRVAAKRGDMNKAKQYVQESLNIYRSLKSPEARGVEKLLASWSAQERRAENP